MSQVTLYLDAKTEARMRTSAEAAGISLSRWLRDAIQARLQNEWPADVIEMAGTWPDAPKPADLRHPHASDAKREVW